MKLSGKTNIWPGYVASIASLLLSILLLIGVLVIAMSQVDALVSDRIEVIGKMVEEEKIIVKKVSEKPVVTQIIKPQQIVEPKIIEPKIENKPVKKLLESIRVVVEAGVFSLDGEQLNELNKTIKETNKEGVTWQVSSCRINNSSTSTQDSFGLMFQVRDLLKKDGVNLEGVSTQLRDCNQLKKGVGQGEILIELIPTYPAK